MASGIQCPPGKKVYHNPNAGINGSSICIDAGTLGSSQKEDTECPPGKVIYKIPNADPICIDEGTQGSSLELYGCEFEKSFFGLTPMFTHGFGEPKGTCSDGKKLYSDCVPKKGLLETPWFVQGVNKIAQTEYCSK